MVGRLAGSLVLVAMILAPLPARAATCDGSVAAEPAPLCGTTTLTGSSPGYVLVSVPATGVVLDNANINVEGNGAFVGMVLTSDPPYLTAPDCGTTASGLVIQMCPNDQVQIRGLISKAYGGQRKLWGIGTDFCSRCTLGEGTYRLYLVTEGSPVTVTIGFPELTGATTLEPRHAVYLDAREPQPSLEPNGLPVYGGGFTGTFPTPGLEFAIAAATTSASVDTQAGGCFYLGDPGDPRIAYQPHCPGFVTGNADVIDLFGHQILPITNGTGSIGYVYPFPRGEAGIGGFTVNAGAATDSFLSVMQLGFDQI